MTGKNIRQIVKIICLKIKIITEQIAPLGAGRYLRDGMKNKKNMGCAKR